MKLRIRENTVRLRLKQREVKQLAAGRSIAEETHFPDSVLTYRLDVYDGSTPAASFEAGNLAIRLPEALVTQWTQTDQVSISAEQPLGGSDTLSLLIEKDFKCLAPGHHRLSEDDADTFPHPGAESGNGCR